MVLSDSNNSYFNGFIILGGLVGLFCGMSVLSAFEVIYWLLKYLQGIGRTLRKANDRAGTDG